MKPTKKILGAEGFFQTKIKLENELIRLEELERDAKVRINSMIDLSEEMIQLSKNNESPYFLQRSKRLNAEIIKFKIKNEYKQKEFDSLFHILEKIKSEDKIEFLDSALKNRINRIANHLIEKKISSPQKLNGKLVFICYMLEGVHFLIPKKSYRILRDIPAFKKQLRIKDKLVPLFPGPGFVLMEEGEKKQKNVILLKDSSKKEHGFYFDELKEDWAVSKTSLEEMLEKDSTNGQILGKIKRKGKLYHLVKI
ncbi:hypothetical protein ND861_00745 [Leptospira sp. 2 VSF19]|uniref:Uncharacterized protein n=1 Tax=Leptospira soteropolitanensis TaxID=2950025 RepID=A0AAW5V8K1_9LEPT|nr:hypothetical protein [Leptospira soteropolitanensis]MCW7491170.1 hypothetical protein [Leptospira soteropolitanensis]MCW7498754.1 hypothetical protein [Leptospira soteropolitanensis]MCW7521653.1 hypothetical protein [Leptospira soteropolitanensis]MCW7524858.1 hypothetical protein [Leptospira soteropolitanensis]MCW7528725.1 hypothetical protein [Leptospira soteropolitanensis]